MKEEKDTIELDEYLDLQNKYTDLEYKYEQAKDRIRLLEKVIANNEIDKIKLDVVME
jgi:hypothetical protein